MRLHLSDEVIEGLSFQPSKRVCIAIESAILRHCADNRKAETITYPSPLQIPEVATTTPPLPLPPLIVLPRLIEAKELSSCDELQIEGTACSDYRTDFEGTGQGRKPIRVRGHLTPDRFELSTWGEDLSGDRVTEELDSIRDWLHFLEVGDPTLSYPEVGEFMDESEHLCGDEIGIVDEDKRSILVDQDKAPELFRVQAPVGIIPNHTIDHYHHSNRLDTTPQIT